MYATMYEAWLQASECLLNLTTSLQGRYYYNPCYSQRNFNTEILSDLPEITQLVSGRAGI